MAEIESVDKLLRQLMDMNLRYYGSLGRLTVDYYKGIFEMFSHSQPGKTQVKPGGDAVVPGAPGASTSPAPVQSAGVMVLENEAGMQALGVFLVSNDLDHEITAQVEASPFVADDGHTVQPEFIFDPKVLTLSSHEQLLVRVIVRIDYSLKPEVRYKGEFIIPKLGVTRIPIVIRRRSEPGESQSEASTQPVDPAQEKAPSSDNSVKGKRTAVKRESSKQRKN